MFMRLAQVVYTRDAVRHREVGAAPPGRRAGRRLLRRGDRPRQAADAEGLRGAAPADRGRGADRRHGALRARWSCPGSANVFEANVTLILLDENGKELVADVHHGHLRHRLPRHVQQGADLRRLEDAVRDADRAGRRRRRRRRPELQSPDPGPVRAVTGIRGHFGPTRRASRRSRATPPPWVGSGATRFPLRA